MDKGTKDVKKKRRKREREGCKKRMNVKG